MKIFMQDNIKEIVEYIKEYGKSKNYKVFLVFVMISTFFWLLIKLSKEYTTIVSFPINYVSVPNDVIWGDEYSDKLHLSTTASGFQHLGYVFSNKKIDIDLSKLRKLGDDQYYLLPKEQFGSIIRQFPGEVKLVYRGPDSLFFDLSKKISKTIPVVLNDSLVPAPSYKFVESVKITPDSVIIMGPASMISKIDSVETEFLFKDNIRKDVKIPLAIKDLNNDRISVSNSTVDVSIKVEQFTQNTISVPIIIRNVPDGYLLKIFPDKVDVTFNTSLSQYPKVKHSSFTIVADYNKIDEGKSQVIPLEKDYVEKGIELIKIEPSEVEFLLSKIK